MNKNVFNILLALCGIIYGTSAQAQGDGKLFSLLDAKHTKVDFNNVLTDTREANILIYSNFYGGAGVGIGDIDGDGLQDLYFAGNQVADRLYINKGNLEFEDISENAGIIDNGGWSSGVLFADINGDGWLDIYVTRELYDDQPELRRNVLYMNNGDQTFTERAKEFGLDDSQRTRHATFIDYDKDGDLDIFLLNQPPNPGDFSSFKTTELMKVEYAPRLMENQGNKFIDVTEKAGLLVPCFPNSVTAGDLNNDGWTDLFIANDFWIRDFIYMNNGDGTFTDKAFEMTRHISFSSMGVDAGDINNDGWLDVIVLDMVAADNFRRKSNMSGMPKRAFEKVVREKGHHQYMYNMLHINNGDGLFSETAQFSGIGATDWSWSVLFADFDNDGRKDVYISNGLMRDIRDNDAARSFQKYIEGEVHKFLQENPDVGDVSLWDIVNIDDAMNISPSVKLRNYAYRNTGDLTFIDVSEEWGMNQKTFSNGSAYADLDNDGDLDLVINNINDTAMIYENHADKWRSANFIRVLPVGGSTPLNTKVRIEYGDKMQYTEITSVRGMYSTSEHVAHFGLGDVEKVDRVVVEWPDGKKNILKNQKANKILQVAYSKAKLESDPGDAPMIPLFRNATNEIGLVIKHNENRFDDFEYQMMLPHKFSDRGPAFATGDVNGDELEDIFMGGSVGTDGRLFIQNDNGSFGILPFPALKEDRSSEDIDALFLDVDSDGDLDLYIASGGNEYRAGSKYYQDRLYLNDGNGNLEKSTNALPKNTSSSGRIAPADFDNDGDLDLFITAMHTPWEYPLAPKSALLRNKDGKFEDVTSKLAPELTTIGMVHDASWVDYNNDGLQDLILAGEWMPITLFKNEGTKFTNVTENTGLKDTHGWWFSIESADFDADGDMDFLVGNLGLNYEYKASSERPFHCYYYDFDNNGTGDLVLAKYEGNKLYPVRERNRSVQQVPLLAEKFPAFHEFAEADIFKIYGKENLDRALHCKATMFRSVFVENLGNGQFSVRDLPFEAQLSPINDMLISDFNQDGHLDVLTAGNLYGVEVETVRPDAGIGLLLTGDGKGNFNPIPHQKSGILIPKDMKRIKTFIHQNQQTIIVGSNNDYYQLFKINQNSSVIAGN